VVFRRSVVFKASGKALHRQGAKELPALKVVLRELRALRGSVVKSSQFPLFL